MKDDDLVDSMGDDIMEAMELKNGKICDDSYHSCGGENEMDDDTYYLYGSLGQNTRYSIYIRGYFNQPMAQKML